MPSFNVFPTEIIQMILQNVNETDLQNFAFIERVVQIAAAPFLRDYRALIRTYSTLGQDRPPNALPATARLLELFHHAPEYLEYVQRIRLSGDDTGYWQRVHLEWEEQKMIDIILEVNSLQPPSVTSRQNRGMYDIWLRRLLEFDSLYRVASLLVLLPNLKALTMQIDLLLPHWVTKAVSNSIASNSNLLGQLSEVSLRSNTALHVNRWKIRLEHVSFWARLPSVRVFRVFGHIDTPTATSDHFEENSSLVTHLELEHTNIHGDPLALFTRQFSQLQSFRYSRT